MENFLFFCPWFLINVIVCSLCIFTKHRVLYNIKKACPANTTLVFEEPVLEDSDSLVGAAMETVLRFGKYKGLPLYQVVGTKDGRQYLNWMLDDENSFKLELKEKVKLVLEYAIKQTASK